MGIVITILCYFRQTATMDIFHEQVKTMSTLKEA
jgi:hypothetical protein